MPYATRCRGLGPMAASPPKLYIWALTIIPIATQATDRIVEETFASTIGIISS